jgi:hypothetical protein
LEAAILSTLVKPPDCEPSAVLLAGHKDACKQAALGAALAGGQHHLFNLIGLPVRQHVAVLLAGHQVAC